MKRQRTLDTFLAIETDDRRPQEPAAQGRKCTNISAFEDQKQRDKSPESNSAVDTSYTKKRKKEKHEEEPGIRTGRRDGGDGTKQTGETGTPKSPMKMDHALLEHLGFLTPCVSDDDRRIDIRIWGCTKFKGGSWSLSEGIEKKRRNTILDAVLGPRRSKFQNQIQLHAPLDLFFASPLRFQIMPGGTEYMEKKQEVLLSFFPKQNVTAAIAESYLHARMVSEKEKEYAQKLVALAHLHPKVVMYFPVFFQPHVLHAAVEMVFSNFAQGGTASLLLPGKSSVRVARELWKTFLTAPDSFCYPGCTPIPQKQIFRTFPGTHVSSVQALFRLARPGSNLAGRLRYVGETFGKNPSLVGDPLPNILSPAQEQLLSMGAAETDEGRFLLKERLLDENKCHVLLDYFLNRWEPMPSSSLSETSQSTSVFVGTLNARQAEVCLRLVNFRGLAVVKGPGGSGKTFTITTALRHLFLHRQVSGRSFADPGLQTQERSVNFLAGKGAVDSSDCPKVMFLAPTQKATRKLQSDVQKVLRGLGVPRGRDLAGTMCKTVHQFVIGFQANGKKLSRVHAFVIDESSMVDNEILAILLDCFRTLVQLPENQLQKIIFMGDGQQLLPVGAGCPFQDLTEYMLSSPKHRGAVFQLHRNMRTSSEGGGALLAHIQYVRDALTSSETKAEVMKHLKQFGTKDRSRIGGTGVNCIDVLPNFLLKTTLSSARDFFAAFLPLTLIQNRSVQVICQRNVDAEAINSLVQLQNRWPKVLTARNLRKGMRIIVNNLRNESEVDHSGSGPGGGTATFGKGDILQVEDVYNGPASGTGIRVRFSFLHETRTNEKDNSFEYVFQEASNGNSLAEIEEFSASYAYAFTVHKAQGSSIDRVIFVLPFNTRAGNVDANMVYTAASRARFGLTYICGLQYLASAVLNAPQDRHSKLLQKLQA